MNTRILYLCKSNGGILLTRKPPKLQTRQKHRGAVTDLVDNITDLRDRGWRVKINQATIDYILTKEKDSLILEPWQYVKLSMNFDIVETGNNFYMYKYNERPIVSSAEPQIIMDSVILPDSGLFMRMCDDFVEYAYGITNVVGVLPVIMTAEIVVNKRKLSIKNDLLQRK